VSDRGDEDDQDGAVDIGDEAEEIAHELPELICDPDDESAEEAAMHIEDPNGS
jgi:hypothetical protein